MGLSNQKEEQLRKMPLVEFKVMKSKDGKYIVHKTTITDIKPLNYYKKVIDSSDDIALSSEESISMEPATS
jgi:hypothetical protein